MTGSSLRVGDVTVTEGNRGSTSAVFTVTLNKPASDAVTLAFAPNQISTTVIGASPIARTALAITPRCWASILTTCWRRCCRSVPASGLRCGLRGWWNRVSSGRKTSRAFRRYFNLTQEGEG